jgi:hypothetical protein
MGPAAWGESDGTEPGSPSSVLETLALHPSGNSKVRRMSKEFERLLQHRACAGEQPLEEQPCCKNPVAAPGRTRSTKLQIRARRSRTLALHVAR